MASYPKVTTPKPETGVGETGSPDDGDTSGQELVAGLTAADDAVVEVAAAHPDVPLAMAALLAADVSGGHRGVHAVPRAQIHLASWMDWFPAPGQASAAFVDLSTVFAPTTASGVARDWRTLTGSGVSSRHRCWGIG